MVIDLDLRPPAHLVSRKARVYWTVRAVPGWVVVGGVEFLILFGSGAGAPVVTAIVVITALLALTHLIAMPQWRYRVHRWELTDTAAYTQSGWVSQERRIAPIARVQTVDTQRGPLEQLFGLSNVTVTTASARGPIKIHALDRETADQIVTWLTARADVTGGDAT